MESQPKFVSPEHASELLGVTTERVEQLCDEGLLRRRSTDTGGWEVQQEDLVEIHQLNLAGMMRPGALVRKVLLLEREVSRLKSSLELLYEVNGLSASRFVGLSDIELAQIYRNVVQECGNTTWTMERMLSLAEVFIRLSEIDVDRLNDLLGLTNGWLPFYQLCLKLTRFVGRQETLKTELRVQQLHDLLWMARKNLQTIAIMFIEQKALLGPSRELLAVMAAQDVDAFDELAKQLCGPRRGHLPLLG